MEWLVVFGGSHLLSWVCLAWTSSSFYNLFASWLISSSLWTIRFLTSTGSPKRWALWCDCGFEDSPKDKWPIMFAQRNQTISEKEVRIHSLKFASLLVKRNQEFNTQSTKKKSSKKGLSWCWKFRKWKMTKPNTLDLKEPQQNLRNLKRQSRKAQNKKAKPNLWKEIMTKLEKEDKQEKGTQKRL